MEWLETDGFGGFAMGNASGIPMRRYHALLIATRGSPSKRSALVNSVESIVEYNGKDFPISTYCFSPGILNPSGIEFLKSFVCDPWPTWIHEIDNGIQIQHFIFMCRNESAVYLGWKLLTKSENINLKVRPFLSGRDYHSLHHKNPDFNFKAETGGNNISWQPYQSEDRIIATSNSEYLPDPLWFENILYEEDRLRGSDHTEDLASPGIFKFQFSDDICYLRFSTSGSSSKNISNLKDFLKICEDEGKRRSAFPSILERSADSYIVQRSSGKTIIAGYPWFADWGRDTFISIRGLCFTTKRFNDAEDILWQWSNTISEGMLPNRFLEYGEEAEYNSVDASLWYVIAAYEFLNLRKGAITVKLADGILKAINLIVSNFIKGTRYGIKLDKEDGLLSAGQRGYQLTWMDAKVGDYVVTPRIGKPVEIQALWLNVLKISHLLFGKHEDLYELGLKSFNNKFYNSEKNCLYDVIEVDHQKGVNDASVRPNQIFAVGGLPFDILDLNYGRQVVATVQKHLVTPLGLRTLAPNEPGYRGRYNGDAYSRDTAYHQGTVWPWLMGAFIEAWLKTNNFDRTTAKKLFYDPLIESMNTAGLGHISEIADGDFPHVNKGCPFQAWSVGEALRAGALLAISAKS